MTPAVPAPAPPAEKTRAAGMPPVVTPGDTVVVPASTPDDAFAARVRPGDAALPAVAEAPAEGVRRGGAGGCSGTTGCWKSRPPRLRRKRIPLRRPPRRHRPRRPRSRPRPRRSPSRPSSRQQRKRRPRPETAAPTPAAEPPAAEERRPRPRRKGRRRRPTDEAPAPAPPAPESTAPRSRRPRPRRPRHSESAGPG